MGLKFNKDAAMKADNGSFINEGCVCVGMIVEAKSFKKPSGSAGIEFSLEDHLGRKANYVTIYTKNKDGSENFAASKVQALMGILGIEELNGVAGRGDDVGTAFFPALLNKPIGFMLQRENYQKGDGSVGWKMNLVHWFDHTTKQTYVEKVNNTPAETYKHLLEDKRMDQQAAPSDDYDQAANYGNAAPSSQTAQDDLNLPF